MEQDLAKTDDNSPLEHKKIIVKENADGQSFLTIEGGFNSLTPKMIRQSIHSLEEAMLKVPAEKQIALETMHTFADGVYTRTVFMKAGSLITGKIHKLDHIVVIGQGSASVVSEEFGAKVISAPMVFYSRPYVKRALFIHEDMVWTTVHKNPDNIRDLDVLEKMLIAPDYEGAPTETKGN
jgi:hypothetical protein